MQCPCPTLYPKQPRAANDALDRPAMTSISWSRPTILALLVAVTACAPRSRSQLVPAPTSTDELYDCVRYELARLGFTIVDSDRAGGFVRAQEEFNDWLGEPRTREVYATALVPPGQSRPHLQITSNRHAHEQADRVISACAPATE